MATYEGWKNYETWAVALWLDNDRGEYEYWREAADEVRSSLPADERAGALAEALKDAHEERVSELSLPGVFGDLMNGALSEVDWYEVGEHLLTE